MTLDPISELLTFEKTLVDWIVALRADDTEPEKKQKLLRLIDLRDAIADLVDKLVPLRLRLAAVGITDDVKELNRVTGSLKSEAKTFETLETVLDVAATVAEVAGKILASLA